MKKRVIKLSYFFDNKKSDIKKDGFSTLDDIRESLEDYNYCKYVYSLNSYLIDFYIYRHLYYALNLGSFKKNKIILDLGCADGPFLPTLNLYGKKVIGLDNLSDWLLRAKDLIKSKKYLLKKVVLLNAEGHYIPFRNNSIDLIYCLETLEHIPNTVDLINEIYRILKINGTFIYSFPIEIGFSLILRQLTGILVNYPTDNYTLEELFKNGILKRPGKHISTPSTHKNFDWRKIQKLIKQKFKQMEIIYSPFPFLRTLNPTVIFKAKKSQH